MDEEDFRTRIDAALDEEAGPPIGALVAAATLDGERRRRHRRILQLTSGTVGVAAVVAGATLAAGYVGQDSRTSAPTSPPVGAAATTPTPQSTPTAPSTPTSSTTAPGPSTSTSGSLPSEHSAANEPFTLPPVPPGKARTTAESMLLLLEQQVTKVGGAGDFTHLTGYAPDGDPSKTESSTSLGDLYWNHSTIAVRYVLPPTTSSGKAAAKPAGDVFRWYTPGVTGTPDLKDEKSTRGVTLTRADGSQVTVLEINGREVGTAGPDRADLPLTSDQLLAIARDPHWGPVMDQEFVAEAAATIHLDPTP